MASLIRAWRARVEQRELRPPDPVGIVRDGELGQGRRNGLADAPGIGTEVEQGESQTLADLEEPVGPVPDLLGLACEPPFFRDHAVQRPEPPVILGEPGRRIELADGELELALLDRAPTLVDPAPDLGLEEQGVEPVLDQAVRAGPQHQEQEHRQRQPPAVPAKPADDPPGHRLARTGAARRRRPPEGPPPAPTPSVSVGGFRRQAPADDRLECRRHVRMAVPQAGRSGAPNLRRPEQCRAHRDRPRRQGERPRAADQAIEEDHPQGIKVGTLVDSLGGAARKRFQMLGCHVGQGPAHARGEFLRVADLGFLRQVEVEQHRQAVAGHQHVRGLDVAMQDAPVMGVLQGLRHPGPPPGDRLGVAPPLEGVPAGRLLDPHALRRLQAVQQLQQLGPGANGPDLGPVEDLEERDPAEVGHAEQMQAGGRVGPVGIDGNDVGVLQPRQGLRLARAGPRHLEGNGPIGQMLLLGQVNPRECTSSQLLDQPETRDRLAGLGQPGAALASPSRPGSRSPSDQLVNRHDFLKGAGEPGEPDLVFRRLGRLAGLLAEAVLLVQQGHQQLVVELGKTVAVRFDRARLTRFPAEGQVGPQQGHQTSPALAGILGEIVPRVRPELRRRSPVRLVPHDQSLDAWR